MSCFRRLEVHPWESETKEWLGLALADEVVYAGGAFAAATYLVKDPQLDWILLVAALILSLIGCVLGMRWNSEFNIITNLAKVTGYPTMVGIIALIGYFNFTSWTAS